MRDICINVDRSEGVYFWDKAGKKYIDWCAGAVSLNLGHTMPPAIKKAMTDQMDRCAFVYGDNHSTDARIRLSNLMAEMSPGDLNGFYFSSSGAEANECAIRMAKRYTGRNKVMSRYRSYHGGTPSALAATGDARTWQVDSFIPGFVKIMDPFPENFKWDDCPIKADERQLNALH